MIPAYYSLASVILGITAGFFLGPHATLVDLFAPAGTLWVNALRAIVLPLVIPLLITGVAGGGAAASISRLTMKCIVLFIALMIPMMAIMTTIAPLAMGYLSVDAQALRAGAAAVTPTPAVVSIQNWLMSLVPSNLFEAFVRGDVLPLIIFALAYGLALSRIAQDARDAQLTLLRSIADVMMTIARWLMFIAPVAVFALGLQLGARLGGAALASLGYYWLLTAVFHILAAATLYVLVGLATPITLAQFARAALPAQSVAIASRSSLASLPALIAAAENDLRLPKALTGLVLPLAVSIFKLSTAVMWPIGAAFIARLYGIHLDARALTIFGATSVLMGFSSPGIPNGGFLVQAPIYAAVGLPVEGLGVLIAINAIPDMFITGLNVTADLAVVALLGRKAD